MDTICIAADSLLLLVLFFCFLFSLLFGSSDTAGSSLGHSNETRTWNPRSSDKRSSYPIFDFFGWYVHRSCPIRTLGVWKSMHMSTKLDKIGFFRSTKISGVMQMVVVWYPRLVAFKWTMQWIWYSSSGDTSYAVNLQYCVNRL